MVWTLGTVSYYNTIHLNSYHTILLLKNLQYHSTWKINCRVPTYCTYNTNSGWYEALRSIANQCDQWRIRWDHFHSIMINLQSITINFPHLPSLVFSRAHMRPLALTCNQAPLKISMFLLEADFVSVEYLIAGEMKIYEHQDLVRKVWAKSLHLYGIREWNWQWTLRKIGISIFRSRIFLKLAI